MSERLITESLELVAERGGDPTPLVYVRIFEEFPEMKKLFILDRDDSAKGNMLAEFIECILDLSGEAAYAKGLIQTEVINHANLGVPPEVFGTFFSTIRDVFREICDSDWTPAMEAAWDGLIAEFEELLKAQAA